MEALLSRPRLPAAIAVLAVLAVALGGPTARAHADGDPASDVLVQAPPVFIPAASGIGYAQEAAIAGQLRAAAARGRPLRVAVIPDRIALGSVGALWGQPQPYAEFLGRELSLDYHGQLLVVMPDGFGVSRDGSPVSTSLTTLRPKPGQLVTATEQAIAELTGSGAARVRLTAAAAPSRTTGVGWWIATALTVAAVAGGWWASLRARPPRRRRAATS